MSEVDEKVPALPVSGQAVSPGWLTRLQMRHGRKAVIFMPYLWLLLLFMLPFLIVFKISLAEMARAIPPYTATAMNVTTTSHPAGQNGSRFSSHAIPGVKLAAKNRAGTARLKKADMPTTRYAYTSRLSGTITPGVSRP